MSRPLKILIVSSEVEPIASTGELGRSVGGLAKALKGLGIDARVVMPKYQHIHASSNNLTRLVKDMQIRVVNRFRDTAIYRDELPGEVPVYLLEKDKYFARDHLYGPPEEAYPDNAERFTFFNIAVLEMMNQIGFFPNVIHCHDWHSGLIPAYLKTLFASDPLFRPIKTLFTVHDLRHQGCFPQETLRQTDLPDSLYTTDGLEYYGQISFLKSGLMFADIITTESKRYSQEIQSKEYGRGMEGVFQLRSKDLYGVVNGVEYKKFDPRIDPFIAANFTKDERDKKRRCRDDLLEQCSLKPYHDKPVVGMISPMYEEKGLDLLIEAFDAMMALPIRFIYLNDTPYRNKRYSEKLVELMGKYRKHARCYTDEDEALKHKILAGADFLLMPSQSEPCGVTQMYALKYGTIPIAHATGGLDDTIVEFQPESGKGTGFKFTPYTPQALVAAIQNGMAAYRAPALWDLLQTNAMRVNYSWVYSAKKYLDLYKLAMNKPKNNAS